MAVQRFDSGPRLSRVVVHGDTVYLAGLTADKSAGQSVRTAIHDFEGD